MKNMDKSEKIVYIKFCLLQISHWLGFGAMASFVVAYLLNSGMSNTVLSVCMAVYMFMAFLGQFFWGTICDRNQANKKVFIVAEALVLCLYFVIYYLAKTPVVYLAYPLLGFVIVPISSNLDSWVLKVHYKHPECYGPTRGCSALGFGVFMFFYGKVISSVGYGIMLPLAVGFMAVTLITAFTQPDPPSAMVGSTSAKKMNLKDIGALTKIPVYMILLLLLFVFGISMAPLNNMKIVVLQNVGGTVAHQGYDSFLGCIMQTPFFFLAAKFKKWPQNLKVILAVISVTIMIVGDSLATNPFMIIAFDSLYFVGYSLFLPTYREITEEVVSPQIKTTAHGLCDSVFASLAGMISMCYSGAVIDNFGMTAMFRLCTILALAACGITALFVIVNNRRMKAK